MGTLKPGATYIYERDGHKIYAREAGTLDRQLIGYDWDGSGDNLEGGLAKFNEERMWKEILKEAKNNPTLQDALDRAIMIYTLSKEYDNGL